MPAGDSGRPILNSLHRSPCDVRIETPAAFQTQSAGRIQKTEPAILWTKRPLRGSIFLESPRGLGEGLVRATENRTNIKILQTMVSEYPLYWALQPKYTLSPYWYLGRPGHGADPVRLSEKGRGSLGRRGLLGARGPQMLHC